MGAQSAAADLPAMKTNPKVRPDAVFDFISASEHNTEKRITVHFLHGL
jgi:hypothetical protein